MHVGSKGILLEVRVRHGTTVPANNIIPFVPICRDTILNPSQISISKLCLSVMQIILKVNSASSILSLSPILTLLQVSDNWLVIGTNNRIRVCDYKNFRIRSYEVCAYSMAHIPSQSWDISGRYLSYANWDLTWHVRCRVCKFYHIVRDGIQHRRGNGWRR